MKKIILKSNKILAVATKTNKKLGLSN